MSGVLKAAAFAFVHPAGRASITPVGHFTGSLEKDPLVMNSSPTLAACAWTLKPDNKTIESSKANLSRPVWQFTLVRRHRFSNRPATEK